MIHLYAFVRAGCPVPAVTGLEDREVTTLPCGPVDAVISEHGSVPVRDREAALRHAAVVGSLAPRTDLLPVRFGSAHRDAAALRESVDAEREALVAALDAVGGHVEFVIRPAAPPTGGPEEDREPAESTNAGEALPGRAYLERRLAAERTADRALAELEERLEALGDRLGSGAVAVAAHRGPRGPERCFLVPKGAAPGFRAEAEQLLEENDDLVLGGPWAPYTFADAAAGS